MKIYPGKHQIVQTDEVVPNIDIPLAYIDSITSNYKTSVVSKIVSQATSEVIPYTTFDSQDVCLFDSYGMIIDNSSVLQRNSEDSYTYVPKDTISFNPERFSYSVIGKKKITYASQKSYALKVGCIDTPPDLLFAKKLMKVFGDAPRRNVAPTNVTVNNMDLSIESLTSSSIEENDFIFLESTNGTNYPAGPTIDVGDFLGKHANLWMSVDDYYNFPIHTSTITTEFKIVLPKIISSISYSTTKSFILSEYTNKDYIIHNIFDNELSPVLILESPNKGFIIVSPKEFLDNVEANVNLFYEIMMYVYSNTYVSVDSDNEWITDKIPDYIVLNGKLVKKDNFTSQLSLARMFGLSQDEISLANIDIKNTKGDLITYIKYIGITSDYIIFDKEPTENYSDPIKPEGYISVFTPRQDVIYFKAMLYLIEDNINDRISYKYEELSLVITISSFKSSIKEINIRESTTVVVPLTKVIDYKEKILDNVEFYLCCKNNIISTKDKVEYTEDDGIIIAEIQANLESQNKSEVFDMRQRGGGLAESEDPNYELLDIGNVFGRPYREAGTLIITMPKHLEAHEEIILKAIKKHMLAEDLPVILFE